MKTTCKRSNLWGWVALLGLAVLAPQARGSVATIGSCLDGIWNGDEAGIDCGGSCPAACQPLRASIIVDEPQWYHDTTPNSTGRPENLCHPNTQSCYYPDLGMSLTKGYAPFPVFFQGWNSTPRDEIVRWRWDFGPGTENDSGGRYAEGFNAAHVFETPGAYNVTLTVTDFRGNQHQDSMSVTVMANSGVTYYVDSAIGNDNYDGKCADVSGTCGPWKTATKVLNLMPRPSQWAPLNNWFFKPGDRVLFRRGQTFSAGNVITIGHGFGTQGYYLGAYGNPGDPKPLIQWTGPTASDQFLINLGFGTGYIGFADLQFNFLSSGSQLNGLLHASNADKNLLFLRVDFFEPFNGAIAVESNFESSPDTRMTGFFVVECSVQNPTTNPISITQLFAFGAKNYALLRNNFDKSGNHIAYQSPIDKGVVVGNKFSRPAFGRTAMRFTGGKANFEDNNLYIADNFFMGWIDPVDCSVVNCNAPHGSVPHGDTKRYNYGLINISPGGSTGEKTRRDIIFERNVLTNFEQGLWLVNAENVVIRNNLFVSPSPYVGTMLSLSDTPQSLGITRPLKNIKVVGNTFLMNGIKDPGNYITAFIRIHPWVNGPTPWGTRHENVRIMNNLFVGAAGRAGRAITLMGTENGLLDQLASENNVIHIPGSADGKIFQVGSTGYTLEEWISASGGMDVHSSTENPRTRSAVATKTHQSGEPSSLAENIGEVAGYIDTLRLSAESPRGNGVLFNTDSYFDFSGRQRYADDGVVDIGAFEFDPGYTGLPHAEFTADPTSGEAPLTVALDGSASHADGGVAAHEWDFDYDGVHFQTRATGEATTHVFTAPKTHRVALRVRNHQGSTALTFLSIRVTGPGGAGDPPIKTGFSRFKNVFNPSRSEQLLIRYGVAAPAHTTLRIFDRQGKEIRTLLDRDDQAANHTVSWDGKNGNGEDVVSGQYTLMMEIDGKITKKKVVVIK